MQKIHAILMLINYSGTRFLSTENYNIVTQFPGEFRLNTSDYKPPPPSPSPSPLPSICVEVKTRYHEVLKLN